MIVVVVGMSGGPGAAVGDQCQAHRCQIRRLLLQRRRYRPGRRTKPISVPAHRDMHSFLKEKARVRVDGLVLST
eukprot:225033-Rhodomonas_salina.11